MKGPLDRTKVVLRHLPPSISQSTLTEQLETRFAGRFNWFSFLPGKSSQKRQSYSRAYIDFKRAEDVIEFAEFFDGHVFVNEKGTQFKTIVEYAPSQRVPKQWSKKDGREGSIFKDPEYLEFLEFIAKPVENLPSAEIQLERREAERGAIKDAPIITPLMDYIRQKRAAKGRTRRSLSNGKPIRRASGASTGTPSSASSRRGSEKRRVSTTMYVLRDNAKSTNGKDKSAYILVPKRDDQQASDKNVTTTTASGIEMLEEERGVSATADIGKKKILLLKGKEKEIPYVSGGLALHQSAPFSVKNSHASTGLRQNQRREASGRIVRSILLNKETRQSQSPSVVQPEQQIQISNQEKDKRPPRPPNAQLFANGATEDKGIDLHGFSSEKQEKRMRNKDRPDRGVWTPLRRSDGSYASDESLSSATSQSTQLVQDSTEGTRGEIKNDMSYARSGEFKPIGSGRSGHFSFDNGSHKHGGRRGSAYNVKDADGCSSVSDGKLLKRGGSSGYGPHEKQVWIQKSSSGS